MKSFLNYLSLFFVLFCWSIIPATAQKAILTTPNSIELTALKKSETKAQGDLLKEEFTSYELFEINTEELNRLVKKQHQEFTLNLSFSDERSWEINLNRNEMRAAAYQSVGQNEQGMEVVEMPDCHTFAGFTSDEKVVRLNILENKLDGYIQVKGDLFRIIPYSQVSKTAADDTYIVYLHSNKIKEEHLHCGSHDDAMLALHDGKGEKPNSGGEKLGDGGCLVLEVATEADFEYFQDNGNSVAAANAAILGNLNLVEGMYQTTFGMSFTVTFQRVWTIANDPYFVAGNVGIVTNELRPEWEANMGFVQRDVVHMWSGKNHGGLLGAAFQAVICNVPTFAYGFTADRVEGFETTGHEIGHNFDGAHADATNCGTANGSVMCQGFLKSLVFSAANITNVNNHMNGNDGCLTEATNLTSVFHFEDAATNIRDEFCDGEEIFLNGAASEEECAFYIDAWRRPCGSTGPFGWVAGIGWTQGEVATHNLTQLFAAVNFTFQPGFEYQIKLATQNSCVNWVETLETFKVHPNPEPKFEILNHCEGDDQTVTAEVDGGEPPYTYAWSTGDNTETITVSEPANGFLDEEYTYSLTVTDANGCTGVFEHTFTVYAPPAVTVWTSEVDCETGLAQICFFYPENPNRKKIQFNLGSGWLDSESADAGSVCYDVTPGTYDLSTQWGNGDCPVDLGTVTIDPINSGCDITPITITDSHFFDEDTCLIFINTAHIGINTGTDCAPVSFTYVLTYSGGLTFDVTANTTITQDGDEWTVAATGLTIAVPPCTPGGGDVSETNTVTFTYADGSTCTISGGGRLCNETPNLDCDMCDELCPVDCCAPPDTSVINVTLIEDNLYQICIAEDECEDIEYSIRYREVPSDTWLYFFASGDSCRLVTLEDCTTYEFQVGYIGLECDSISYSDSFIFETECDCCEIEGSATLFLTSCKTVDVCITGFEECGEEVVYNVFYIIMNGGSDPPGTPTGGNPMINCFTFDLDPCRSYQFFVQVAVPGCDPVFVPIQCGSCDDDGVFYFPEFCCEEGFPGEGLVDHSKDLMEHPDYREATHTPEVNLEDYNLLESSVQATVNPNPFSTMFEISVNTDFDTDYELVLIDVQGKQIKSLAGSLHKGLNKITVDELDGLAPGVFFFQLQTLDGLLIEKVIKQ